jgi:hypothetical protein
MLTVDQNPEQLACHKVDFALLQSGWLFQNNSSINPSANIGIAVREYKANVGPSIYFLYKRRVFVLLKLSVKRKEHKAALAFARQ